MRGGDDRRGKWEGGDKGEIKERASRGKAYAGTGSMGAPIAEGRMLAAAARLRRRVESIEWMVWCLDCG